MAIAVTVGTNVPNFDVETGQDFYHVYGTLTFSGSYATGGDSLSFANVVGLAGVPHPGTPLYVWIQGINGNSYGWVKATGKVKIFAPGSATELAAGAYSGGGVTGDTIFFEAAFLKY